MKKLIRSVCLLAGLAAVSLSAAAGQDAVQKAGKGHSVFLEVLAGDVSKFPEAVKLMEESRGLDPKNVSNLYNLARVYFYDALTNNNQDSLTKAERAFAQILQINPEFTQALSFHGSTLTSMSRGADLAKFMQGAEEMKTAVEKDPRNINNRIVIAFTAENFPPQALAAMGDYDNLKDLEFVRDAFGQNAFHYAPHAQVVMNAFVGEAYKRKGDEAKARSNFEAALAFAKPSDAGQRKGRELLDAAIRERMNGGERPLRNGVFSGCHSCHLSAPDKLLR